MSRILGIILKWVGSKVASLVIILIILLISAFVKNAWAEMQRMKDEVRTKETLLTSLGEDLAKIEEKRKALEAKEMDLRERHMGKLKAELVSIKKKIDATEGEWGKKLKELSDFDKAAAAAEQMAADAKPRYDNAKNKIGWWEQGAHKFWLTTENDRELKAASQVYLPLAAAAVTAKTAAITKRKLLGDSPVSALLKEKERKDAEINSASASVSPEMKPLNDDQERKEKEIAEVRQLIDAQRERIANDPRERIMAGVKAQLPTAFVILAGVILAPIGIKGFFYYILAPLASKLPPIRILPNEASPPIPQPTASKVSLDFDISATDEILVHSDFLQGSDKRAVKCTQYFLNSRLPFSSIASGMYMLTRIRSDGESATRVVVSSQSDAFGEIGALVIPEGAAMVVQPRALAAVIIQQGKQVMITRHWQIGKMHAWLTLQLRYLVFHGPITLIIKGCRGIRAEESNPEAPRMINQASTIGFSANLDYKNTRCETFIAYLRGKEELFNDEFSGGPGRYVYEEMPSGGRRTGLTGRGLEGAVDAALKVFGI
jgi:hypothetical protein